MSRYLFWLSLLLLVFFRYLTTRPNYPVGERIRITAKISSEPIRYDTSQYLKLAGLKTYIPLFPEVHYGDLIVVEGIVGDGKLLRPIVVSITESKGVLYKLRRTLVSFYQKVLPEPHASLVAGVTIGSKASIPKEFWENLKRSGTAHVVVASGMNVTLVAGFLLNALVLLVLRRKAVPLALTGVWFYAILSGFDAPIIRAAIMGSIALAAQELGRLTIAYRALFLSAILMLSIWPEWLTDLGFILSFVATGSLLLFQKRIAKFLKRVPNILREDFSTSLAAQIGVAPILFISFGQFNILSPLINALVLWTIVPITIIGMVAGLLGLIFEPFGRFLLYLIYPLTSWFNWVVGLGS